MLSLLLVLAAGHWLAAAAQRSPPRRIPAVRLLPPLVRTRVAARDSVRADSVRRRLVQLDEHKILDSLRALTRRKTIMGRLASVAFDFRNRREDDHGLDAVLLNRQYEQHSYKVVRRIDVTALDAFGYSLNDLTRRPTRFWEKAGNALHITTRRAAVRRALLFRPGDALEPQALSESERLLRQTPHILDARVLVNEATSTLDSVDIIIITKDVFSLGGSAAASPGSSEVTTRISDDNFLGLGHQMAVRAAQGYDQPQPWRTQVDYAIENLTRGFVNGRARYLNQFGLQAGGFTLERGFVTATTRWAGAAAFDWYDELIGAGAVRGPTAPFLPRATYAVQDFWLGRSYELRTYDLDRPNRARLITAGRLVNTTFARVPAASDTTLVYQNRALMLASVGLSARRYFKDRYLFGFGRTEDVPVGTLLAVLGGYESGARVSRPYYGVRSAAGYYRPRFGYLYGAVEFGAYRRSQVWEQGLLNLETLYFTKLVYLGAWQWRQFFWLRSAIGLKRRADELLSINQYDGVRGFSSGLVRGQRRVVLNYESNFFTPVSFLGFRLATILFADVAWLAPDSHTSPFRAAPYGGVGVGIRLRNEYIAFRTVQILLGFYPRRPPGEDLQAFRIYEASRPFVSFRDFNLAQPATSEFR